MYPVISIGLRCALTQVPEMAELGFDALELPLQPIMALTAAEFDELLSYLSHRGVRVGAVSGLPPEAVPLAGPGVRAADQRAFLAAALERARRLGAQVIVLDDPAARRIPETFDPMAARRQLGNFLRIAQGYAANAGVRIAIQNLRRTKGHLVNTVGEAALACALLNFDCVGVAADTVEMAFSGEPVDALRRLDGALYHLSVGSALTGRLPKSGDGEDYAGLFRLLMRAGYRESVYARSALEPTVDEAAEALSCLRRARAAAQT